MSEQSSGEGAAERPERGPAIRSGPGAAAVAPRSIRDLLHLAWDHVGMLSALLLGLLATLALLFLAIVGFTPALVLLVVLVAGIAMLVVGGRIRA